MTSSWIGPDATATRSTVFGTVRACSSPSKECRRRMCQVRQVRRYDRRVYGSQDPGGPGLESHGNSDGKKTAPSVISSHERDQRIRNTYAMVDLIDQGIGKMLSALEETGELDNTVIVFLSDHGELMGDHGTWLKGPFSTTASSRRLS